jgi:uncharacterized HAD superfamily protein
MEKTASIYVDMDDVLTQSSKVFLNVLEREFGKKKAYAQITDFDLKASFGLTETEYTHFFQCVHEPEEILGHTPVPGAKETMARWQRQGYRISIMTGRPTETRDASLVWLDRHGFTYDAFFIVNKYGRDGSNGDRSISLEDLSSRAFDLAVEDSGDMARFLSEHMDVRVALLNRPWNQNRSFNHKVRRCEDWTEIETCFGTL